MNFRPTHHNLLLDDVVLRTPLAYSAHHSVTVNIHDVLGDDLVTALPLAGFEFMFSTVEDFEDACEAMAAFADERVNIHCTPTAVVGARVALVSRSGNAMVHFDADSIYMDGLLLDCINACNGDMKLGLRRQDVDKGKTQWWHFGWGEK